MWISCRNCGASQWVTGWIYCFFNPVPGYFLAGFGDCSDLSESYDLGECRSDESNLASLYDGFYPGGMKKSLVMRPKLARLQL